MKKKNKSYPEEFKHEALKLASNPFEYIEVWYNRLRRHSALGYQSPEQYEQKAA